MAEIFEPETASTWERPVALKSLLIRASIREVSPKESPRISPASSGGIFCDTVPSMDLRSIRI